jgi:regulatory protein
MSANTSKSIPSSPLTSKRKSGPTPASAAASSPSRAPDSLEARALRALARREHSRSELAGKLARYTENASEIEIVLAALEGRGLLSEGRFVETLINARRKRYGPRRIGAELREKGVSEPAIGAALKSLKESELECARGVWEKKFGEPARTFEERARQYRFLQRRGFSAETIHRVLRSAPD